MPAHRIVRPVRDAAAHGGRALEELEAESVAYLVCKRHGVESHSETYLAKFVTQHTTIGDLEIYRVMRAAGRIETLLGLAAQTSFG